MKKIFLIFTVLFTCALPMAGFGDTDTKTRDTLLSKAYSKYCDDEGYTPSEFPTHYGANYADQPTIDCSGEKGKVTLNCYKIKDIQQSLNQEDLKHFCSPDTITNFTIKTVTRPSTHIRDCKAKEKNAINATACKISAGGEYSDIVCKNGYEIASGATKCEKSDTPDKKTKPALIKISGIVIDASSQDEQTIGGVRIKYNEGKKDKDGNEKNALHQTGNNGRFAINIVPGSTITFTHKMYKDKTTEPYSAETKDVKIEMSPTDETVNDRKQQKLCEENKKGTWNKTKKECNCKGKNTIFNATQGCVDAEEFKFEGVVQDTNSTPIPDVKVKYGNQSTTTDTQGKFTLNAPKDTEIVFSYKGYKNQTYTLTADTTNKTINMEPTEKSADNAKKKELCETEGPNKGTWNETLKTCKCKGKAFFDEDEGCVESTEEYRDAEDALETLYEQFNTQLGNIKSSTQP